MFDIVLGSLLLCRVEAEPRFSTVSQYSSAYRKRALWYGHILRLVQPSFRTVQITAVYWTNIHELQAKSVAKTFFFIVSGASCFGCCGLEWAGHFFGVEFWRLVVACGSCFGDRHSGREIGQFGARDTFHVRLPSWSLLPSSDTDEFQSMFAAGRTVPCCLSVGSDIIAHVFLDCGCRPFVSVLLSYQRRVSEPKKPTQRELTQSIPEVVFPGVLWLWLPGTGGPSSMKKGPTHGFAVSRQGGLRCSPYFPKSWF